MSLTKLNECSREIDFTEMELWQLHNLQHEAARCNRVVYTACFVRVQLTIYDLWFCISFSRVWFYFFPCSFLRNKLCRLTSNLLPHYRVKFEHRRNLRGIRGYAYPHFLERGYRTPHFLGVWQKNNRDFPSFSAHVSPYNYPGKRLAAGALPQKPRRGSYCPHTSSYLRNRIRTI